MQLRTTAVLSLLVGPAAALVVYFSPLLAAGFCILLLAFFLRRARPYLLGALVLAGGYVLGLLRFTLYDQARVLVGESPLELLASGSYHATRFLVAYPSIWLSSQAQISLDKAFTFYSLGWLLAIIFVQIASLRLVVSNIRAQQRLMFAITIGWFVLGMLMNGRLLPAFLAMSLTLHLQLLAYYQKLPWLVAVWGAPLYLLILLLASVSSGTLFVIFAQLLVGFLSFAPARHRPALLSLAILFMPGVFQLWSGFFIALVNKNLVFFDFSLIAMSLHGLGRFLQGIQPALLIVAVLPATIVLRILLSASRHYHVPRPLALAIPIALGGGVFGISAGLTVLPAAAIVAALVLGRNPIAQGEMPIPA